MRLTDKRGGYVDFDPSTRPAEWTVTATGTGGAVEATKAAATGLTHYVTAIGCSFSVAAIAEVFLIEGAATTRLAHYANNSLVIEFEHPVEILESTAVKVSVTAGAETARVWIAGFTA